MRLIDSDALKDEMEKLYAHHLEMCNYSADGAVFDCIEFLDNAPTIDAVPVVHGEWINRRSHLLQEYKECSVCGNITEDYIIRHLGDGRFDQTDPNYCPNCGAKMDGGKE